MNFFTIAAVGYAIVAIILIYLIYRDQRQPAVFFGRHKKMAWLILGVLVATSAIILYSRFVEPFTIINKKTNFTIQGIKKPIKIAFIADPQLNNSKNDEWVEKIITKTEAERPDVIIFGGDLISNEGYFYDTADSTGTEAEWLNIFAKITQKYPSYYVLGNHEYGFGNSSRFNRDYWIGDQSREVANVMEKIGAQPLNSHLSCLVIDTKKLCLFGVNDVWGAEVGLTKLDFSELKKWDQKTPLIFITHNPDGILYWPKNIKKPDLVLAGHSHGGQIYIPFIDLLGDAGIKLGKEFYRGLNYYQGTPIYTSVGLGESGGSVRFMTAPELTVITLVP